VAGPAIAAGSERFFARTGPHTLAQLVAVTGGELRGDGDRLLYAVAPLQTAGPEHVSFLDNRRYASLLGKTRAGAVLIRPAFADDLPPGTAAILLADPYVGWARVAALFHPPAPIRPGRHPSAVIADTAHVDPTAEIGPLAVIEDGAEIGPGCRIAAGAVIGARCVLGPDCRIGPLANLSHAILGARVYIYPGARIGQEGFGFATTADGHLSVPQLGRVLIGDDAEIGANTTVDRGSAQDTVIGPGCRLDNLVQVGHNVQMGRCCVIVAQVGIAGSTTMGDFVVIAGQAGFSGHTHIGDRARIGAQSGVMTDVPAGGVYVGSPAQPASDTFREVAALRRLARRPASKI